MFSRGRTLRTLILFMLVIPSVAQNSTVPAVNSPTNSSQQANGQPPSRFEDLLSSQLNSKDDSGDYIPCLFSIGALRNLRPTPVVDYLTPAEAESLKTSIIAEVLAQADSGFLQKDDVVNRVSGKNFDSKTRSEAISNIVSILQDHDARMLKVSQSREVHRQVQGPESAALLASYQIQLDTLKLEELSSTDAASRILSANDVFVANLGIAKLKADIDEQKNSTTVDDAKVKTLETQATKIREKLDVMRKQLQGKSAKDVQTLQIEIQDSEVNAQAIDANVVQLRQKIVSTNTNVASSQRELETKLAVANAIENSKTALLEVSQEQTKVGQAIVDKARSVLSSMTRPPDVGCAMSILSWREVQKSFGRLLANEYIAVQVVVRNLNESKQFLIHDAELAVDTDINGRLSRFYSGRDQKIVRQLSLAQSSYHYRNLIVNILGAVGTVASDAMAFAGPSFKDATGVYNGGFIPAFGRAWPDRGVDQLNLLNDVGFSASTDSKAILVPKSGAAMFVLFVPSKQFEQVWWAQECAEGTFLPIGSSNSTPQLASNLANSYRATNQPGIDFDIAREKCSNTNFKRKPYHEWSPIADNIFKELAFTVVAGTHIAEQSKTTPIITQIDCPKDSKGNLDFGKQSKGSLNCKLTGQNLDKVVKIKLRNAADATDNATAEGVSSTSGDSTVAMVDLPLSQIGPLAKSDYKIYTVTKEGAEDDGKQTLHLSLNPFLIGIKPDTVELASGKNSTIQLNGYHLDKLDKQDKIGLSVNAPDAKDGYAVNSATVNSASFEVAPSTTKADPNTSLQVWLILNSEPNNPQITGLNLKITGLLPQPPH